MHVYALSDGGRLPDEDRNMEPSQLALPQQNRFCDSKLSDEQSEVTFTSIIVTHASHEDQLCDTEINCSQGVVTKDSASGSQVQVQIKSTVIVMKIMTQYLTKGMVNNFQMIQRNG